MGEISAVTILPHLETDTALAGRIFVEHVLREYLDHYLRRQARVTKAPSAHELLEGKASILVHLQSGPPIAANSRNGVGELTRIPSVASEIRAP